MRRFVLISLVMIPALLVAMVLLNNTLTAHRVRVRGLALHGELTRAGLVGKSRRDLDAFLSGHGLICCEGSERKPGQTSHMIIGETESLGWILNYTALRREVWHVTVVFTFNDSTQTVEDYTVCWGSRSPD